MCRFQYKWPSDRSSAVYFSGIPAHKTVLLIASPFIMRTLNGFVLIYGPPSFSPVFVDAPEDLHRRVTGTGRNKYAAMVLCFAAGGASAPWRWQSEANYKNTVCCSRTRDCRAFWLIDRFLMHCCQIRADYHRNGTNSGSLNNCDDSIKIRYFETGTSTILIWSTFPCNTNSNKCLVKPKNFTMLQTGFFISDELFRVFPISLWKIPVSKTILMTVLGIHLLTYIRSL